MSNVPDFGLDLAGILGSLPIACFVFDPQGQTVHANQHASRLRPDCAGKSVRDLFQTGTQAEWADQAISSAIAFRTPESFEMLTESGEVFNCDVIPILDSPGSSVAGVVACTNITRQRTFEQQIEAQLVQMNEYSLQLEQSQGELEEANRKLEALASTDGLTGLYNHRRFQEFLAAEVQRAERYGEPISMILMDIDHFKSYNDTYGHPSGDAVLRQFAQILTNEARGTDIVARYGGEEFTAILPETNEAGAMIVAERFRCGIQDAIWPDRAVTCSMGVSSYQSGDTTAALIKRADLALYASKGGGRNRVTHSDQLELEQAA